MVMETAVSQLVAGCSACERIKNTPMPFAIVVHLRCVLPVPSLSVFQLLMSISPQDPLRDHGN